MADILIRMNMPNSCVECSSAGLSVAVSILGASCPWCREIIDPKVNLRIARHEDCPLYELPPHGDLIDKDAFIAEIKKNDTYQNWLFRKMLEKQPVVVPADKEDT